MKLIIFDFDGVIIDSWEHAYEGNRHQWPDLTPEQHRSFFNGNIHEEIAKLPTLSPDEHERHQKWFFEVHGDKKKALPVFDGMQDVVNDLAQTTPLVINTSSDEASTAEYLENNDMAQPFEKIYGKEVSKDKVKKFNMICAEYGVSAEECLFITDTVGDVLEAECAGIPTILVSWGYQTTDHFTDEICNKVVSVVHTPEELRTCIHEHS